MKLHFLNTIGKRISFSIIAAALIQIAYGWFYYENILLRIPSILMTSVFVFIPVTLFYAVVSTFFTKDDKEESDEILDD